MGGHVKENYSREHFYTKQILSAQRTHQQYRSQKNIFPSLLDPVTLSRIIFFMENNPGQQSFMSRFFWLAVFGIAMGILEAIVVVYLRELYFPGGFRFPLKVLPEQMLRTEVFREICTIVMLAAVAALCARTFVLRFSLFLFTFGVWDIFYYVFLKILLDWPESLFTWDVLFLMPVTWLGPVLAPLICSVTMITFGLTIIFLHDHRRMIVRFGKLSCLLLSTGAAMIFLSFTWDYTSFLMSRGFRAGNYTALQAIAVVYTPTTYHWGIFLFGEALVLASVMTLYRHTVASANNTGPKKKKE
jgi:hypothetical protein